MSAPHLLNGKCLCGDVSYRVADEFEYAMICHCNNCQRATGSAFKPFAGIKIEKLVLDKPKDAILVFGDEVNHDAHCAKCGSLLFSLVRDGTYAHVTLGTLIDQPFIQPTHHIFVKSKADWLVIGDDLPQFQEFN
ncbi:GFA family protein [Maritalea sp.]|uniref:GFA family protein n=1 Tax=Maritalea sp. TaxID=2003361 RepID=UPI003EF78ADA